MSASAPSGGGHTPFRVYAAITTSMLCFALSFVWFKVANVTYGPLTIILFRIMLSAVLVALFNVTTRQLVLPTRRDLPLLCLLGLLEPFLYFVFESYGLQRLSATVAAVIISMIPLVTPFAAYVVLRERVRWQHVVGIIISFLGVSLVVLQWGQSVAASPLGVLLQFGAVLSAVGYTIALQKVSRRINALSIILYQNLVGTIYFLPLWLALEARRFAATPFDAVGMLAIVKLSVVASTLAFIFYTYSVRRLGANRATLFTNIVPVLTAIFAWWILGDTLSIQKGIGMAVVIAGLLVAERPSQAWPGGVTPVPRT